MTLAMSKKNQNITINSISDKEIRAQAIRIGVFEGAKLFVSEKINNGPVILRNQFQEIAIGNKLAQEIIISVN